MSMSRLVRKQPTVGVPHSAAYVQPSFLRFPSPKLADARLDIGSIAAAMVYYDRVIIGISASSEFAPLLRWFITAGCFDDFLSMLNSGALSIYFFPRMMGAASEGGLVTGLVEFSTTGSGHDFEQHILGGANVIGVVGSERYHRDLRRACVRNLRLAPVDARNDAARNAEQDFFDGPRCSPYLKAWMRRAAQLGLIDEGFDVSVEANVQFLPNNRVGHQLIWKANSVVTRNASLVEVLPDPAMLLSEAGRLNQSVQAALNLHSDLWPIPLASDIVVSKLAEAARITKAHQIIERLDAEVDFPDIAELVNKGTLSAKDILHIRAKAGRFRLWLQSEGERDRNAILAYHNEVSKASGLQKLGRSALTIASIVAGAIAAKYAIPPGVQLPEVGGFNIDPGVLGSTAGGLAREGIRWLGTVAKGIEGGGWRPSVFGQGLEEYVRRRSSE